MLISVNLRPKYFFQSSESQTPNMFVFPKFQTPNMYTITPVIKVDKVPPWALQTPQKVNFWCSVNITNKDFKELLDFNKINHAEPERMKSKRTGKDMPFIKIKSDDPKQAESVISGGLVCQKTGIIFRVEEFKTTPSILQCFKCQGFRHKAPNCTINEKCVACGEAHSHKNCPNKEKGSQSAQIVGASCCQI